LKKIKKHTQLNASPYNFCSATGDERREGRREERREERRGEGGQEGRS